MVEHIRNKFNKEFDNKNYQAFLKSINNEFDYNPPFRIAETPIFIPNALKHRLIDACNKINDVICLPDFKEQTDDAISHPTLLVPGEDYHTRFLQMDFAVTVNEQNELIPQLIEIQGFPSLYFFQDQLSKAYRKHFNIPGHCSVYLDHLHSESYMELLRQIIVGDNNPENVILLEIEPEKQATYIDFLGAEKHLGIKVLCISDLKKSGKELYYLNDNNKKVHVQKIYNRVIFDELIKRDDIIREFYFHDDVDVEWVGHPNWFFRISKYTLPLLKNEYVPDCSYLNTIKNLPEDLENYVLKPMYSFAGSGVKININKEDLDTIKDKENYILQKKIQYSPVIKTLSDPAKCEIRMLMLWEKGHPRARIVNNLVRLSKGEMVGVRYNKDKDWVGASVGYFANED